MTKNEKINSKGEKTTQGPKRPFRSRSLSQKGAQSKQGIKDEALKNSKEENASNEQRTVTQPKKRQNRSKKSSTSKEKLKIISLGGLNEIGKNITIYEYANEILIVDCGLAFPDDEMLGIDIVIPDMTYLIKNKEKVKGLIVTHGHEDHIGGIPYLLKEINVPIYSTKMTIGLIKKRLEEHNLADMTKTYIIAPHDRFKIGVFDIEAIRVNHSIADAMAFAIRTPVGMVIQTGDFKIDPTPIQGEPIDLARFGELGKEGVLALLMDSTNVERPGYAMSERKVGESFDNIFKKCSQRIIVATFASNVDRVQQIIDAAVKFGRKVAISGRSMLNMLEVAIELGYITAPPGVLIDIDLIGRYTPDKIVIITTGSQGEPMSALYRMAFSEHRKVDLGPGDLVIISATPIPGNERLVYRVVNELYRKGAEVLHESLHDIHVSGHACQEELKIILGLTKPKFFIPVHGEYRHLFHHAKLAKTMGVEPGNIMLSDIGKVIELDANSCKFNGTVPSGKIMVDGLSVGDVGNIVMRDRIHLAQDGLIAIVMTLDSTEKGCVAGPDVVSRGFVYVRESEDLMEEIKSVAADALDQCLGEKMSDWTTMKNKIKAAVSDLVYEKTKRKPMILPVIMEV